MTDISVRGDVIEFTATTLDYRFHVTGRTNLKSVRALDNKGMGVDLEPLLEKGKTNTYVAVAKDIARERFPLMAIVEDCEDNIFGPRDLGRFGAQSTFLRKEKSP